MALVDLGFENGCPLFYTFECLWVSERMVKMHGNHYDPLAKLLGNGWMHSSQGKDVEINIKAIAYQSP